MAFKLNKKQEKTWEELLGALETAQSNFAEELDDLTEQVKRLITLKLETLGPKAAEINNAVEDLKTFAEERSGEWRDEHSDKSENWQDSEKGQEIDSWISNWENPPEFETADWSDILRTTLDDLVSGLDIPGGIDEPPDLNSLPHEQYLELAINASEA